MYNMHNSYLKLESSKIHQSSSISGAMDDAARNLELPGFRFHPTEEELLEFYLKNIIYGKNLRLDIIGLLNIYHHDPWDLPGLAKIGEREWYFFVPRDRKHANGGRPNRTTEHGFWKATGSDRRIFGLSDTKRIIGLRKTLVFYKGRAPKGCRTGWVMNEYRLPDSTAIPKDIVLCKIYRKATSLKVLEQRAAMDTTTKEAFYDVQLSLPSEEEISSMDSNSFCKNQQEAITNPMILKREEEQETLVEDETRRANIDMVPSSCSSIKLPPEMNDTMFELQLPKSSMDWTQDQLWSQLNSPWFQNLTPITKLLNI